MARLPTYFVSHGGGPWPWMREQTGAAYDQLAASLAAMRIEAGATVRAVLVVTAHWEAPQFMVSSGAAPGMIYDYGGFPPHTYQISYPAPGEPALARRVAGLLEAAGFPTGLDAERGFDHGTFSMLYPVYPEARMPVVQMSLRRDLDPAAHLAAGRALAPLRDEGILIIGSGCRTTTCASSDRTAATPRTPSTAGCSAPCSNPTRRNANRPCCAGTRRRRRGRRIRARST